MVLLSGDTTTGGSRSPSGPSEPQELEARDKETREMQFGHDVATHRPGESHPAYRQQSLGTAQERPDSQPRDPIPSACETVFEEEEGSSSYSGQEAYANARPITQVRLRNTIDSFVNLYHAERQQ